MDFKYQKIYINFKEVQGFMENVKHCCDKRDFKPDAVIGIEGGGEVMEVVASDVFGKDIQISTFDKNKKILVVSGLTTPRSISAYFKKDERFAKNCASNQLFIASMFHRPDIDNNPNQEYPHFSFHQLYNDQKVVFPWKIYSSMREDIEKEQSPYCPNYWEDAPDTVVNENTPNQETRRFVPWHYIEPFFEQIRAYLKETGKKPDAVFGPPRGGIIYAKALSDYLGLPWSAELDDNMIYAEDIFDTGKTAEKTADFKNIINVAMTYRAGRSVTKPDVAYLDAEEYWMVHPHERYQNGYDSESIKTINDRNK
jgi:hypoxanthine phosphoribosyltransferase